MRVTVLHTGQVQNFHPSVLLKSLIFCPSPVAPQIAVCVNEPLVFCSTYMVIFQAILCFSSICYSTYMRKNNSVTLLRRGLTFL